MLRTQPPRNQPPAQLIRPANSKAPAKQAGSTVELQPPARPESNQKQETDKKTVEKKDKKLNIPKVRQPTEQELAKDNADQKEKQEKLSVMAVN